MTLLENTVVTLMQAFDNYAAAEGKKNTLTKSELKTLMEKELPGFIKNAKNPAEVDKLMKAMDNDGDTEVDFPEFVTFVVALACMCHSHCPKK
ncbi:hypothetical protein GJAV_G00162380 [Gymnothorax javanicus]|nr:hypothetical protein GJAV_G00162380 [Gymnothorax javanicus]